MPNLLNRYIFLAQNNNNEIILYNSLNGAIVLMDTKDVETQFKNVGLHDREELEKLGFFDTDQGCSVA